MEIQAFKAPTLSSGTYHVAANICAKSMVQSFAAGKLNYSESFLLHAKTTQLQQRKRIRQKECLSLTEMIRLETIKQHRYLLAYVMRSRKTRVISVNDILAGTVSTLTVCQLSASNARIYTSHFLC